MKKILVILVLVLLVNAFALKYENAFIKLGTSINRTIDSDYTYISNEGFETIFTYGGVVSTGADFLIENGFYYSLAITFLQKGDTQRGSFYGVQQNYSDDSYVKEKYTYKLQYLGIDNDFKYKYNVNDDFTFFSLVGFYYMYNTMAKSKFPEPFMIFQPGRYSHVWYWDARSYHNITQKVKDFDSGLNLGVGFEYTNYIFEAKISRGLTKFFGRSKLKNLSYIFTLGYKF